MEWVKTTAKTLPEAIDLALDNLGVDESEAEIEVIEEPKATLFGLRTKGVARVQARVKPKSIRPKNTRDRRPKRGQKGRNDRRRNNRGSGGGNNRQQNQGQGSNKQNRDAKNRNNQNKGRRSEVAADNNGSSNSNQKSGNRDAGGQKAQNRSGNKGSANRNNQSKGRNRRGRNDQDVTEGQKSNNGAGGDQSTQNKSAQKKPAQNKPANEQAPEREATVQEVADHVQDFLEGLTEAFGLEGDVVVDDSEDNALMLTVEGQHGLMVGPKGRTLDAIQELARISAQRSTPSSVRIKVDVGGYRAKRNAALADFATRAADKAVDNGSEVALEPMTPADRKIVHDALNGDDRVETRSVGNEPRRRVLVVPLVSDSADVDEE